MGVARYALPGLLLSVLLVAVAVAPEPTTDDCPPAGILLAEFDVTGRAAIRQAIPRMGTSPELASGGIVVDGTEQVPTVGGYRLALYRCMPTSSLPILGGVNAVRPQVLYGVMHVTSPTGFDLWYSDVDFSGLRVPST